MKIGVAVLALLCTALTACDSSRDESEEIRLIVSQLSSDSTFIPIVVLALPTHSAFDLSGAAQAHFDLTTDGDFLAYTIGVSPSGRKSRSVVLTDFTGFHPEAFVVPGPEGGSGSWAERSWQGAVYGFMLESDIPPAADTVALELYSKTTSPWVIVDTFQVIRDEHEIPVSQIAVRSGKDVDLLPSVSRFQKREVVRVEFEGDTAGDEIIPIFILELPDDNPYIWAAYPMGEPTVLLGTMWSGIRRLTDNNRFLFFLVRRPRV